MDSNETNRTLTEAGQDCTPQTSVPAAEQPAAPAFTPKQSQEEIIARLEEINEDACNAEKQEIDFLKQNFYKLHKAEQEAALKAHIENGGTPENFVMPTNELEGKFKLVMSAIKEKKKCSGCRS